MQNRNYNVEEIAPNTLRIDEFGLDTLYLVWGEQKALVMIPEPVSGISGVL